MLTIFKHPVARLIAVVALGCGLWRIVAWHGEHITECGVDAHGVYARVGYNSFGDGLVKPAGDFLGVDFYYDGAWYSGSGGSVKVSVLGSTTTLVRGAWPPRVVDLGSDGGPRGKITVAGRAVGGHWVNTDPSLKKTYPKLKPHFKALVDPNDKSLFGCRIHHPVGEGD
jgi:hypothetical protein